MKRATAILLAVCMLFSAFLMPVYAATPADGVTFGENDMYYLERSLEEMPHTIETWLYIPEDAAMHSDGRAGSIIGNYPGVTSTPYFVLYINDNSDGTLYPQLEWKDKYDENTSVTGDGICRYGLKDVIVERGVWTHIAITFDVRNAAIHCYKNGVLAQTLNDVGFILGDFDARALDMPWVVGNDNRHGQQYYFKGSISEIALYSDVRAEAEVKADYDNGASADSNMLAHWEFTSQDIGRNVSDISGNSLDLTYSQMWIDPENVTLPEEYDYSMIVVGDTQYMVRDDAAYSTAYAKQVYKWIADNAADLKLEYVMGVGDITDQNTVAEWEVAYEALSQMDDVVNYSLVRGNHDVKQYLNYMDTYFGSTTFYGQQFDGVNGGMMEDGSVLNTWYKFTAGQTDWLVINLDWKPTDAVLEWADGIIKANSDRKVIITTHCYMHRDGRPYPNSSDMNAAGLNYGEGIWDKLAYENENVTFIFSGHIELNNIVFRQAKGKHGNTVSQFLIDSQNVDSYYLKSTTDAPVGIVTVFYFDEDGRTVDVRHYSPIRNQYYHTVNQFGFDMQADAAEQFDGWYGYSDTPAGAGTEDDPYIIENAGNLVWMGHNVNVQTDFDADDNNGGAFDGKYFKQVCDIDLNGLTIASIGNYVSYDSGKMAAFGGTYDGGGYSIKNGNIVSYPAQLADYETADMADGLFGAVYGAAIRNVTLDNVTVWSHGVTGGIVGQAMAPVNADVSGDFNIISNCHVKDSCDFVMLKPDCSIGTVCGMAYATTIKNCTSAAEISVDGGKAVAGGIAGVAGNRSVIDHCAFKGAVALADGNSTEGQAFGGIVALATDVTVSNCYNAGAFTVPSSNQGEAYFGGIVGNISAESDCENIIENCFNTFSFVKNSDNDWVGGLAGKASDGSTIRNSASVEVEANGGVGTNEYRQDTDGAVVADNVYTATAEELNGAISAIDEEIGNAGNYADYTAVEAALSRVPADLSLYTEKTAKAVTDAVNAVVYELSPEKQLTVDSYAKAINTAVRYLVLSSTPKITAVNTDDLVLETTFLYSGPITDTENRWASHGYAEVSDPVFYDTISVTAGEQTFDVQAEWLCDNYDAKTTGSYKFIALVPGYEFDCEAPAITVTVIDGAYVAWSSLSYPRSAIATGTDVSLEFVYRDEADGIQVYDATGCNKLYNTNTANSYINAYIQVAGVNAAEAVGQAGKTLLTTATEETHTVTLDGVSGIRYFMAGNIDLAHNGDTYVNVIDSKFNEDSTAYGVYAGGFMTAKGKTAPVSGDVYIGISGETTMGTVSGGHVNTSYGDATVKGTVYVTVRELTDGASIGKITRATAANLVVYLDDTSAHLVSVVENIGTDENTTVYVNDEVYVLPADYSAVDEALSKVPADLSVYTDETAKAVTDAVNAVVYGLKADEQATVDAYAAAIEEALSKLEFKVAPSITAVDTSNLVTKTVFLYSGSVTDTTNRWASHGFAQVINPVFYDKISATVNGNETEIAVEWISEDYASDKVGTYTFTATASGYEWECEAPEITVKVIDGAYVAWSSASKPRSAVAMGTDEEMNFIWRDEASGFQIYDATGFNKLYNTDTEGSYVNPFIQIAGVNGAAAVGQVGKTPLSTATEETHTLTLDGVSNIRYLCAGNINVAHNGDTYIYVQNSKFYNSAAYGVYAGGFPTSKGKTAPVNGDVYIDISGETTMGTVSGGHVNTSYGDATVKGTVYVTVHGLKDGASIGKITRATAANLVVYLDDTSADLISVIENVDTDENTKVYINGKLYGEPVYADYSAVETAKAKVEALDRTLYTEDSLAKVDEAVNAVVYDLTEDQQETVNGYAAAIETALTELELKPTEEAEPIVLTDDLVNYRLRCTTAVVDGNLVLTANPAGSSSMKVRLGNVPEGAVVAIAEANSYVSMSGNIITVNKPDFGKVEVPMTITSAEGAVTEFVLVGDFGTPVTYMLRSSFVHSGNSITFTSGSANCYIGFEGTLSVKSASRNMLGRYTVSGKYIRFYNPVYDNGEFVIEVTETDGTVTEYNVTVVFDTTDYSPLTSTLRATYTVSGDTVTVTADAGVTNVYLVIGKYYSETLSIDGADENENVYDEDGNYLVKHIQSRGWRVYKSASPIEFDMVYDATSAGGDAVTRHFVINF